MTTHLGTFIPLHGQNPGWGSNGLGQNIGLGIAGFNSGIALNPNSIWGQNTALSHNHSHHPHHASLLISPAIGYSYGNNFGELTQGMLPNGSSVAFVPQQGSISGASFVPSTPTYQGTTVVGVPSAWQGGHQAVGGLTQSFAAELSENTHEYVLSFDVPGIDIQDLDISLTGNTILINGTRKNSNESATLAYSEIARGSISRAIAVPFDVSPSKAINTSLENGVLKIRIAKETQADKRTSARKVKIG